MKNRIWTEDGYEYITVLNPDGSPSELWLEFMGRDGTWTPLRCGIALTVGHTYRRPLPPPTPKHITQVVDGWEYRMQAEDEYGDKHGWYMLIDGECIPTYMVGMFVKGRLYRRKV